MMLCECLDLVRDLEGIVDVAPDVESSSSSSSSSSTSSAVKRGRVERLGRQRPSSSEVTRPRPSGSSIASSALARARSRATRGSESDARDHDGEGEEDGMELSLSALTMRFMPLIECFLTVCGTTSLRVPTPAKEITEELSSSSTSSLLSPSSSSSARGNDSSALGKRKASEIRGTVDAAGAETKNEKEPTTAAPIELTEFQKLEVLREADAAAISLAVRTLSDTVPGARFRNNPGYLLMQLEMDETSPAAPLLLRFADRNRVLLNMVLRNNVHLLESSFSALVTVPRCRHLLHFDIRRCATLLSLLYFTLFNWHNRHALHVLALHPLTS